MMHDLIAFLTVHWALSLAFLVVLLLILSEEKKSGVGGDKVHPQKAVELINHHNAVVLDVRPEAAFQAGHIVDAINLEQHAFIRSMKKIQRFKERSLIVVCDSGRLGAQGAHQLRRMGFKNVHVLAGGLTAWGNAGLPLNKGS